MDRRRQLSEVERLRLVIDTQRRINSVMLDPDEVMRVVTEQAREITGADGGVVELADGDELVYRAVSGASADGFGVRLRVDGSLSGLCLRAGKPLRCVDTELDPRVDREACRRIGVRSVLVVPLMQSDDPVGVLKVMSSHPDRFNEHDVEVLRLLADFIADAIANSAIYGAIDHDAMHDLLTGLPNRALLMDRLEQALHRSEREGTQVGVFFLDLDGFKAVNDRLGHAKGDEMLQAVATKLSETLRAGETVARFGGDEFVIVCENAHSVQSVSNRVKRAVSEVARMFGCHDLGVSVGVVQSEGGELNADELLIAADTEMYRVKRRGWD